MGIPSAATLGVAGVAAAGAWFFPFLVATLAYYHHASNDPERRPIDRENLYKEYDFIVVGKCIELAQLEAEAGRQPELWTGLLIPLARSPRWHDSVIAKNQLF